jgi:hypothetical protein
MAARRAAQGAADAGAIAGARVLVKYPAVTTAQSEVSSIVATNKFGPITPTLYMCQYINGSWGVVGTCNQTVPSSAVGVRVRTRVAFSTYFMQVIPGAPENLIAAGYAKARVESADLSGGWPDAPFIICGKASWAVKDANGNTIDQNIPILDSSNEIRTAAHNVTYRVHDPQLKNHYEADCKSKGARFKGLADKEENEDKEAPDWFGYDTGTKAGPTRAKVNGTEGCAANTPEPYNCIMILPIATNNPAESGNSKDVYVVAYGAFQITTVDSNSHNAKLIPDYIMSGVDGTDGWCRDCTGAVVVRLIW